MTIQRAILIINLVLITLGAYFGAGLFYQIWALRTQPAQLEPIAQANASTSIEPVSKPYTAYRPILQRDLFKTQKALEPLSQEAKINLEEMEETKLQLKLWGTVTGDTTILRRYRRYPEKGTESLPCGRQYPGSHD